MSTYTVIELHTAGPIVTWGPPDGAVMGEELIVPYISDEELVTAVIRLIDGRVLPMTITALDLRVELPDDTPEGAGTITVTDDLGNPATHVIPLSGVIFIPEETVTQGWPLAVSPQAVVGRASIATVSARYTVAATVTGRSHAATSVRWTSPGERALNWTSRALVASNWTQAVRVQSSDPSRATGRALDTVVRRPEGPGAEEDLIFLGLL